MSVKAVWSDFIHPPVFSLPAVYIHPNPTQHIFSHLIFCYPKPSFRSYFFTELYPEQTNPSSENDSVGLPLLSARIQHRGGKTSRNLAFPREEQRAGHAAGERGAARGARGCVGPPACSSVPTWACDGDSVWPEEGRLPGKEPLPIICTRIS